MNAIVATKLHASGVFIPGVAGNEENALSFWSKVFGWEGKAATPEERVTRTNRVTSLLSLLNHADTPKGVAVYFTNHWYHANRPLAYKFFSCLQELLGQNGRKWKAVAVHRGMKGFTW